MKTTTDDLAERTYRHEDGGICFTYSTGHFITKRDGANGFGNPYGPTFKLEPCPREHAPLVDRSEM